MLIVANFPFAVLGGRIVCPRARGWARPRLSSSARAGQVWLVSLVPAGGREAKQGPRSVASVSSPDRWGSWRMGGGGGTHQGSPGPGQRHLGRKPGTQPCWKQVQAVLWICAQDYVQTCAAENAYAGCVFVSSFVWVSPAAYGSMGLNLEAKGESRGQRGGPLSSQREQGYGNSFEGRFQAAWEEEECLGNCGDCSRRVRV